MFISALLTIAKIWKQPKCPSVDECIKQIWGIYTMEYYSAVKKKILPFVTVWMDLENIMLSVIRQIPYYFTHVESNEQTELTTKIETNS